MYDVIVVGGGAAGFFAALAAKDANPQASVLILEKSAVVLSKVRVSGGGRCNVTHACFDPHLFCKNYPRGEKELLGPFNRFQAKDTIEWFEARGVILKTEADGRMFPITDSSETVIRAFLDEAKKLDVEIRMREWIERIEKQEEGYTLHTKNQTLYKCKKLILATGSSADGHAWAKNLGHTIQPPVPSLFTFNIPNSPLQELSGVSFDQVEIRIKDTDHLSSGRNPALKGRVFSKLGFGGGYEAPLQTISIPGLKAWVHTQRGPLLITHFGFSGPAALKLSAWAARHLHEKEYAVTLLINWVPAYSAKETLTELKRRAPHKTLLAENPFHLPKSFWKLFLKEEKRLNDYSLKELDLLAERLQADPYKTQGKTTHKEEFVTCGGVTLKEIYFKTMESRISSGLYFAGEILDIDGITGGFNFQNAWTTGFLAGTSAALSLR